MGRSSRAVRSRRAVRSLRTGALVVLTAVLAVLFALVHVPSGSLIAGLVAGVAFALTGRSPGPMPVLLVRGAQGVLGVLIGGLVMLSTVRALGDVWFPVLAVTVATLALSIGSGLLLGRHPDVDPVTGSCALVAGGASGLVAMARDLGADERIVAVVQYLRVLIVTGSMPAVLLIARVPSGGSSSSVTTGTAPWWAGLLLTVGCIAVGAPLARLVRLPAGTLLGPMLLTAAVSLGGLAHGAVPPSALVEVGYAVIGLQAGLTFDRASVRALRRILPWAVALIVAVIAACAGLGLVLSWATGQSVLDGYLATTPGGLYAVLAAAVSGGADVTFVLAVQVVRLFVMLLGAPALMRLIHRRVAPAPPAPSLTPAAAVRPAPGTAATSPPVVRGSRWRRRGRGRGRR